MSNLIDLIDFENKLNNINLKDFAKSNLLTDDFSFLAEIELDSLEEGDYFFFKENEIENEIVYIDDDSLFSNQELLDMLNELNNPYLHSYIVCKNQILAQKIFDFSKTKNLDNNIETIVYQAENDEDYVLIA